MTNKDWTRNLSDRQIKHLVEDAKVETLADLIKNREGQKNLGIRCLDCEGVERQLIKDGIL